MESAEVPISGIVGAVRQIMTQSDLYTYLVQGKVGHLQHYEQERINSLQIVDTDEDVRRKSSDWTLHKCVRRHLT